MERFFDNAPRTAIDLSRFDAVNASQPASTVSSKYRFIPTTEALTLLSDNGWYPVSATQARVRKDEYQGFQRHLVRLQNDSLTSDVLPVGGTIPQVMLRNSHMGSSAFELSLALYEKICKNGLCVAVNELNAARILHRGFEAENFMGELERIIGAFRGIAAQVEEWRELRLSRDEQRAFAAAAIEMRFDGEKYTVEPDHMLVNHRRDQQEPTLWNTFNTVQERALRGGVLQGREDGSRVRSRAVKNITEDVRLNRALWRLTEEMSAIKGGAHG